MQYLEKMKQLVLFVEKNLEEKVLSIHENARLFHFLLCLNQFEI